MKANTVRSGLVLALTFAFPMSAAAQQLSKYGVNSLAVIFYDSPGGPKGTQYCVNNMKKILSSAGVTVNTSQVNKDGDKTFGIVIGHYQRKLIVSGNCLSGGKQSLISVVNPFTDKTSAQLIKKIKATLH